MIDNPRPDLEVVRGIVEQIARGPVAIHAGAVTEAASRFTVWMTSKPSK